MSHLLFRTRSLLSYLWHGKSRYHVHSDFVFKFINQVLRDRKQAAAWKAIEEIRGQLKKDNSPIAHIPLGAKHNDINSASTAASKVKQTAIPPRYGQLLHRCVVYFGAAKVLELGSGTGISSLYLATPANVERLVSLEGNTALAALAKQQTDKLGLANASIVIGEFDSTLSTVLGNLGNIDLAFIDGDHRKLPTLRYYEQLLPYTHNDTLLIFDDIHWSPEMQEAWQEIIARPEVTLSLDLYRLGLVFFRKEIRQPQHIQLYYW